MPEFAHSNRRPLVVFIQSATGRISHVALGKRGLTAGTDLRKLVTTDICTVQSPVEVAQIVDLSPSRFRSKIVHYMKAGGLLPPKTSEAMIESVMHLAPDLRSVLARFGEARRRRIGSLPRRALPPLASQKEAVATALTFAGISRDELDGWDVDVDHLPSSYLDGLPQARLREDQMVTHDLRTLPGYAAVKDAAFGAITFQSDASRLTVVLANRLPLEEQLGADLIYFNETFKSFLMVQYKAMEDEDGRKLFRLPNEQLDEEITRMDSIARQLEELHGVGGADGFRLSEQPFFLKLCPRIVFDPDNLGLTKGMYMPLDYWKLIVDDPRTLGPRGGRFVSYANVQRYFDNSAFVLMVANSWIGTNIEQSEFLEEVIRLTLETGRAAVVAVKSVPSPSAG